MGGLDPGRDVMQQCCMLRFVRFQTVHGRLCDALRKPYPAQTRSMPKKGLTVPA